MQLTTPLLLALPALAAGQAQKPLTDQMKNWFSVATSSLLNAMPSAPTVPAAVKSPVAAAASKSAAKNVHTVTMRNYEELLASDTSKPGPTEWMILITGGNKSCHGYCEQPEIAFNETAMLFAASATAPKLGMVNCDKQGPLCATWTAKPPTVWWITRPQAKAGQPEPPTTVYINYLKFNDTKTQDIVSLHTGKKYEEGLVLEGLFHPFEGDLKKYGVNKIVGYVIWGVSQIPSWAFMLAVSMFTRQIINNRVAPNPDRARAAGGRGGAGAGSVPLGGAPPANE